MLSRELLGCQMSSRCACAMSSSFFMDDGVVFVAAARAGRRDGLRLASACVLNRSPVARAGRMYPISYIPLAVFGIRPSPFGFIFQHGCSRFVRASRIAPPAAGRRPPPMSHVGMF